MNGPDKRAQAELHGHDAAERTLRAAADTGRLHHGWLLTGPEGIGKATLAFRFARALLADFPAPGLHLDPAHRVFRLVASGAHPDLTVVAPEWDDKRGRHRSEIGVDAVRGIGDFLALTPAFGGWRVVIVDGADLLGRNAANALLKVLEEPPPRAVLLLVAAAPGRLLPTIRSRCRTLRLLPLDEAATVRALRGVIGSGLDREGPEFDARDPVAVDHRTLEVAIGRAAGSPGRALRLAMPSIASLVAGAEAALERKEGGPDDDALADAATRTEGGLAAVGDTLLAGLHERARAAGRRGERAAAAAFADTAAAVRDAIDGAVRFNLDGRQAILGALLRVRDA